MTLIRSVTVLLAALATLAAATADERRWDVTAEFVELKSGQPGVGIFALPDATRFELPLSALSEANRKRIAERSGAAFAAELAHRTASEPSAANVNKARELVTHAIDLLRLGNPQLAKQQLQQASKTDPASGEADFVAAMVFAIAARNHEKAADHFAEVVKREPDHVAALANLALCELHIKKYSSAVEHFRRALELRPDGQAIADNMGLAIQAAGAGRARMSEKVLADLNEVYRRALVDLKLTRLDPIATRSLVFHGLNGLPLRPDSPTILLEAVQRPKPPDPVPNPEPDKEAAQTAAGDVPATEPK